MIEQYHSCNVDLESFDNDTVRRYSTYMKKKYIYFWRQSAEHSKKLKFYKVFKDEYSKSDYLHQLRNFNERRNLVKFKVSNQKLMIELGRYQRDHIPRENRLCPLCKSFGKSLALKGEILDQQFNIVGQQLPSRSRVPKNVEVILYRCQVARSASYEVSMTNRSSRGQFLEGFTNFRRNRALGP